MLYILDSDILSLFQRGDPIVVRRVCEQPLANLVVTVISVEEQLSGWYTLVRRAKGRSDLARAYDRLAKSVEFLGRFEILPFNEPSIQRFEDLRAMKLGVRASDLRIAAISLEV